MPGSEVAPGPGRFAAPLMRKPWPVPFGSVLAAGMQKAVASVVACEVPIGSRLPAAVPCTRIERASVPARTQALPGQSPATAQPRPAFTPAAHMLLMLPTRHTLPGQSVAWVATVHARPLFAPAWQTLVKNAPACVVVCATQRGTAVVPGQSVSTLHTLP